MPEITRDSVLKELKKKIGEKCAQAVCNAGLWTVPNIVHIMEFAGRNLNEIEQVIKVLLEIYKPHEQITHNSDLDPLTLLDMAGYHAFVVKTEEQKNSIQGYYRPNEQICTLRDPRRHINYYMIHAIKKEVLGDDKLPESEWHIKPSKTPRREDEYGTSVISIQILKTGGVISIKNRYNHTLKTEHPDFTFNNNPDNIIQGLSDSLRKYFHVDFTTTHARLPNNFQMVLDQAVRFDYEIDNIYFGPDYYFSGSTITKLKDNGSQLLFYRGFMLDMSHDNSRIISIAGHHMAFCDALNEYIHGKKIKVTGAKGSTKTILLNGERFMDITDGKITFINAPTFDKVSLVNDGVKLSGNLDFSGVKKLDLYGVDLSDVTSIKFNPNADTINVGHGLKLFGDLDFSGVKELYCSDIGTDFTNVTSVKFNPNAYKIWMEPGLKLSGAFDFSGVQELMMNGADFTNVTSVKFNPDAKTNPLITLTDAKLSGDLDFSGVCTLLLSRADFTNVTSVKFNSNAREINLEGTKLSGNLDFSGVEVLNLDKADLTNVTNIKFNPNAPDIVLCGTKLFGNLDFSGVKHLNLSEADLSRCTSVKYNPDANSVVINTKTILSGDVDFSNIKKLYYKSSDREVPVDLSNVTSFKLPDTFADSRNEFSIINADKINGDLNFGSVQTINIQDSNLSHANLLFNSNVHTIVFDRLTGLHDKLSLEKTTNIYIRHSDLSHVTNLKINPSAHDLELIKTKGLSGNFDFSNIKNIFLEELDLSKVTSIKFGRNSFVCMTDCKNLNGNIDLSESRQVVITGTDFSHATSLKLPQSIDGTFKNIVAPSGVFDVSKMVFNGYSILDFTQADISRVTDLRLPEHLSSLCLKQAVMPMHDMCISSSINWLHCDNADFSKTHKLDISGNVENCIMKGATGLHGNLILRNVKCQVDFTGTDLSRVNNLQLPRQTEVVYFNESNMPVSKINISADIKFLGFGHADFSKSQGITISGNVEECVMSNAVGLHGDLDFSNIKKLDLTGADLSKVHSIKFNPKGKVYGLKSKDNLRLSVIKGMEKLRQKISRLKYKKSEAHTV